MSVTDKETHIKSYIAKKHTNCPLCKKDVYNQRVLSHYKKACHLACYEPYKRVHKAEEQAKKHAQKLEKARQYIGDLVSQMEKEINE